MSAVRGSVGSSLDKGDVVDGRSDRSIDMAMQIGTVLRSIGTETAGEDTLDPMERNENGESSSRSEVPATVSALRDWMSRMQRAAQQQYRIVAQLHQTVLMMESMMETHTAQREAQWRVMKLWLEEKQKMRDAYHQDDLQRGKDSTNMVARAVAETEGHQIEERKADT